MGPLWRWIVWIFSIPIVWLIAPFVAWNGYFILTNVLPVPASESDPTNYYIGEWLGDWAWLFVLGLGAAALAGGTAGGLAGLIQAPLMRGWAGRMTQWIRQAALMGAALAVLALIIPVYGPDSVFVLGFFAFLFMQIRQIIRVRERIASEAVMENPQAVQVAAAEDQEVAH